MFLVIQRKKQIVKYVKNKCWLDIGTGTGGILKLLKKDPLGNNGVKETIIYTKEPTCI